LKKPPNILKILYFLPSENGIFEALKSIFRGKNYFEAGEICNLLIVVLPAENVIFKILKIYFLEVKATHQEFKNS